MSKRKINININSELEFREFVLFKLGQHDMALKILITLETVTLSILIYMLKLLM